MLKTIGSAVGIVFLASSFALAGQTPSPTAPRAHQRVTTQAGTTQPAKTHKASKKKHHKKHKHHTTAATSSQKR